MYLNIKEIIREKNLKQNDVSGAIGMDNSQFSRVLNGKGDFTLKQFMDLCSILEVDPAFAYNKEEITKTPPAEAEGGKKVEANDGSKSYALNLKNILAEQKLTSLRLHDIEGLLTLLNQSVGKIQAQLGAGKTDSNPGGAQEQHQKPRKPVKSK